MIWRFLEDEEDGARLRRGEGELGRSQLFFFFLTTVLYMHSKIFHKYSWLHLLKGAPMMIWRFLEDEEDGARLGRGEREKGGANGR